MGARDELFHGRSTLMVELEETATILRNVSKHSLVLLDELGRGTGSCDGSAIACATLRHIALEVGLLSNQALGIVCTAFGDYNGHFPGKMPLTICDTLSFSNGCCN